MTGVRAAVDAATKGVILPVVLVPLAVSVVVVAVAIMRPRGPAIVTRT